jgi:hypothetical protein
VCKPDQSPAAMQKAIDYACWRGADCTQIMQSGACYQPSTIVAHCSYATNSYFQKNSPIGATCDFGGVATLTNTDPSSGTCKYPATARYIPPKNLPFFHILFSCVLVQINGLWLMFVVSEFLDLEKK